MEEKESWGLTEEEIKQRLRQQNQENSKRGSTRGGRSSGQGVKRFCGIVQIKIVSWTSFRPHAFLENGGAGMRSDFWGNGMRDSTRLRSRHRRAGDEQLSTGQLHLDGFESLQSEKTRIPKWVSVFFGRG